MRAVSPSPPWPSWLAGRLYLVINLAERRQPVEHHRLRVGGAIDHILRRDHHDWQIAVVAMHQRELAEPGLVQAQAYFLQQVDHRVEAQADRTGETQVKAGRAEGDDRPNDDRAVQRLEPNRRPAAILPRFEGIGAKREVGAMRFGCANGQQQHIRLRQRLLNFRSRHFVERRRPLLRIEYVLFGLSFSGHVLRHLFTICIILGYIVYHVARNCKSTVPVRGVSQCYVRNQYPNEHNYVH